MPSPNRPAPDLNARILGATLARVSERRSEKRRSAIASVVLAAAIGSWWMTRPDVVPPKTAGTPTTKSVVVERIAPAIPKRIVRISAAHPSSAITRIPVASSSRGQIPTITDDQLLTQLPPDQSAALVQDTGGSTRLIVFR